MKERFRKIIKNFEDGIVVLAGLVVLFLFASILLPRFDYHLFVVQSGSMTPSIGIGSVVVTKKSADYKKNEVISFFRKEGSIVTHRIVDIFERDGDILYKTKGDANVGEDIFSVRKSQIFGKVIISIPFIGYLVAFAKTKIGIIILVLIPAIWIISEEIFKIKNNLKNK